MSYHQLLIALEILTLSFGIALDLVKFVIATEEDNVGIGIIAIAEMKGTVVRLDECEHGVGKLIYLVWLFKLFEV